MAVRELIVFKHESQLGNTQAYKLFDTVMVQKKDNIQVPRKYSDYDVKINESEIPNGVTVNRMV